MENVPSIEQSVPSATMELEHLKGHASLAHHQNALEDFRRERASMHNQVLKTPEDWPEDQPFDYAGPAMKIQSGMSHLDESLPNGQKVRSELAFQSMKQGLAELEVWMKAQGFNVG